VPPSAAAAISEYLTEYLQLEYSSSSHQLAPRVSLKTYNDGEGESPDDDVDFDDKSGTARLLKRFRNDIKTDFVLLPCDISFPSSLTLASILDRHRATPDAVLTSVWHEAPEAVRESEERMIVAMDKGTGELLQVTPLDDLENNDLEMRMALISAHPTLSLSTRLLDAHVYVFRRSVLDLLATRRSKDLSSVKEQFVPWLLKGAWQTGLAEQWGPILNPPRRDPFAAALARSTATSYREGQALKPSATPEESETPAESAGEELLAFKAKVGRTGKSARARAKPAGWSCRVVVVKPDVPVVEEKKGKGGKAPAGPEPEYIVRANNIAGYWEMNRHLVKTLGAANAAAAQRAPKEESKDDTIAASAQISPDSLVGEGVRVGERASIKKCIVGRHCVIGKNAKLTGCVLWDFCVVEEGARLENAVLANNVRVGEKAQIKDCEFGPGFEAKPGAVIKGERMVAGQEA
jgi:translation initiation factor eIF-2B subunit gamma